MNFKLLKKLMIIILFVIVSSNLFAFEKVGVTSFQFLKILPDARSNSMGCAYSSIARGSEGMYWNPATMVEQDGISFNFSRVNYIFDTGHYSGAISYNLGSISLGATYMSANYGDIEVTEVSKLGFFERWHLQSRINRRNYQPKCFSIWSWLLSAIDQ